MKEAGSPQDDQKNVEATHMHNYSEKMRFDNQMYSNAELVGKGTAAADAGDTGPERAVPIPDEDKNGGPDSKLKVGSDEEKMKKRVAQKKESKSDNPNDSKTDRHVMDYSR